MMGEFLVIRGIPRDGILGMDILKEIEAIVDVKKETLVLEDGLIPWIKEECDDEVILNCMRVKGNLEEEYDFENMVINCPQELQSFVKEIFRCNQTLVDASPRCAVQYEHVLEVDESKPFKFRSYPIPKCLEEKVELEIKKMLKDDVIERGVTRYINPLLVVKKKNGDIRLVLDARYLNQRTKPQFETPVNVENLLTKCHDSKIFSKLDLRSSFWLVPLSKESRKYCGFLVNGHCYVFKKVPFGLSSSSAALIRVMQQILSPLMVIVMYSRKFPLVSAVQVQLSSE
ncbi:hypothetical protein QE152_g6619 [Popillia japonica]|uniref:Reverse transcriptase domain-containing protein n=1 Tax=Popillia japonica TaxID=7064 RepID=A0AAW1MJR5_POPJA